MRRRAHRRPLRRRRVLPSRAGGHRTQGGVVGAAAAGGGQGGGAAWVRRRDGGVCEAAVRRGWLEGAVRRVEWERVLGAAGARVCGGGGRPVRVLHTVERGHPSAVLHAGRRGGACVAVRGGGGGGGGTDRGAGRCGDASPCQGQQERGAAGQQLRRPRGQEAGAAGARHATPVCGGVGTASPGGGEPGCWHRDERRFRSDASRGRGGRRARAGHGGVVKVAVLVAPQLATTGSTDRV